MIRQAVITVVGHVDHGKTSLLDNIRGTAVAKGEAGGITQCIGCTIVPIDTIRKICLKIPENIKLPGFLFIDSPGHAAFTNLRKRGGALADIAILVVDLNEGFMPQTLESIEILKNDKTPFVIAANKLDMIQGWEGSKGSFLQNLAKQDERAVSKAENKLYEIVGKLYELGFQAERFDRVSDYAKQLAIVPISAHTGEGIPELMLVLMGLAQKYLEKELQVEVKGPAKGTILEVKEQTGLGMTIDAIIYDGTLKVNDTIVIGGIDKPIITKVRALLEPMPMVEMLAHKAKFRNVQQVFAATGVKIAAPELDKAVAGMPLRVADSDTNKLVEEIQKEVKSILVETDEEGIIIKADTLGSIEALNVLLKERKIPVKLASVGKIGKKDIADAEAAAKQNPFYGVLLGFNSEMLPDAQNYLIGKDVKVLTNNVIYRLIEDYEKWKDEKKKAIEMAELDKLVRGGKFRVMAEYIFRQSGPAVFGAEVLAGRIKSGEPVINSANRKLGLIKSIQEEKESVAVLEKGKQAAVAMDDVVVGRQVHGDDILYTDIPEDHFRKMKDLKHYLSKHDIELLKEFAEIKRKENVVWGI